jgi:hypothetical protein
MSTPEPAYDKLELVGLHEPDFSLEDDGTGGIKKVDLPGFYTVGFMKDGVFKRLSTFKAAGMFADIARAQKAAAAVSPPPPPPPPPDVPPHDATAHDAAPHDAPTP